jgi:uncharacterized protein YkwD
MPDLRTISIRRAAVAALVVVMTLSLLPATTMAGSADVSRTVKQAEWKVLGEINQYRVNHGLVPLRMAQQARVVARERSREMRNRNYLSHTSPSGKDAAALLARRGVSYQAGAENIGRITFRSWDTAIEGMMYGWELSSSHNAAMLSRNYNYVGIGVANSGQAAYFTTIFLKQRDHTAPKSGMVASESGIAVAATDAGTRRVTVRWWGRDPLLQTNFAGIRSFIVQHRRVGGNKGWQTVRANTLSHSLSMTLTTGKHQFRVRAIDKAGNRGSWRRPVMVTVH